MVTVTDLNEVSAVELSIIIMIKLIRAEIRAAASID